MQRGSLCWPAKNWDVLIVSRRNWISAIGTHLSNSRCPRTTRRTSCARPCDPLRTWLRVRRYLAFRWASPMAKVHFQLILNLTVGENWRVKAFSCWVNNWFSQTSTRLNDESSSSSSCRLLCLMRFFSEHESQVSTNRIDCFHFLHCSWSSWKYFCFVSSSWLSFPWRKN